MHRLIVILLASIDAAIAVAVGLAATLAPLTVLWVFGLGGTAQWGSLWPTSAVIWQFGNLVPLQVSLPGEYLAVTGINPDAASFVLSLAPLAFASFTAIFAARSGVRASKADSWVTGVLTGSVVFAVAATLVAVTSANSVAEVTRWQAILFPSLVFAIPLLLGAFVTEWREAGSGVVARIRDRVESSPHGWAEVPALIVRGGAVVCVGLIGAGATLIAVALVLSFGEVIALFESAHLDALGATIVTLAQAAYLPTLVVWALAFIAGPGFAVGTGTALSPAGTQLGVIPGIPILGILPDSTTPWLLLLALLPIGLGAFAGWIARSRFAAAQVEDPIAPRVVISVGISVLTAALAAVLCAVASGSLGPGSLAQLGPQPGAVALAVGVETLVGSAILLLLPKRSAKSSAAGPGEPGAVEPGAVEPGAIARAAVEIPASDADQAVTAPTAVVGSPADERADDRDTGTDPGSIAAKRPKPLPPVD